MGPHCDHVEAILVCRSGFGRPQHVTDPGRLEAVLPPGPPSASLSQPGILLAVRQDSRIGHQCRELALARFVRRVPSSHSVGKAVAWPRQERWPVPLDQSQGGLGQARYEEGGRDDQQQEERCVSQLKRLRAICKQPHLPVKAPEATPVQRPSGEAGQPEAQRGADSTGYTVSELAAQGLEERRQHALPSAGHE